MSRGRTLRRAAEAWPHVARVADAVLAAPGAEAGFAAITACLVDLLGDKQAHRRRGGLKEGERQYQVAAALVFTPDRTQHAFLAQQNFPPEQWHMKIPVDLGHPGRAARDQKPMLLANTDEHGDFQQILRTSRMGSAMYAPMFWQGRMFGMLICAAQARNTMRPVDMEVLETFARIGALSWGAHRGTENLAAIVAA